MKPYKMAFIGPFGDTNFGGWEMIVNNIRSMTYNDTVLFSHRNVLNKELLEPIYLIMRLKFWNELKV